MLVTSNALTNWGLSRSSCDAQHVFTLDLRLLATLAGFGTISRSSDIVRFVQGGVVKTFRCAD